MTDPAFLDDKPYHAHIYATFEERPRAEALRATFARETGILFVGCITEGKAGPHPIPQFEIHFCKSSLDRVLPMIEASGLRALVHPLTKDDLAEMSIVPSFRRSRKAPSGSMPPKRPKTVSSLLEWTVNAVPSG